MCSHRRGKRGPSHVPVRLLSPPKRRQAQHWAANRDASKCPGARARGRLTKPGTTSLGSRPGLRQPSSGRVCPLHAGHRACRVPTLAPMLLVCRVGGVLPTVVAAELLAHVDLAHAAHMLAVHADPPVPRATRLAMNVPPRGWLVHADVRGASGIRADDESFHTVSFSDLVLDPPTIAAPSLRRGASFTRSAEALVEIELLVLRPVVVPPPSVTREGSTTAMRRTAAPPLATSRIRLPALRSPSSRRPRAPRRPWSTCSRSGSRSRGMLRRAAAPRVGMRARCTG